VGAQAGTQAGAEIRPQTQAEAQAQAPTVNVRPPRGGSAVDRRGASAHIRSSTRLTPQSPVSANPRSTTNRHLEALQLEALQHSLNSQTAPRTSNSPIALSASLPYASVPAPYRALLNCLGSPSLTRKVRVKFSNKTELRGCNVFRI
jgi:hypothetical protein